VIKIKPRPKVIPTAIVMNSAGFAFMDEGVLYEGFITLIEAQNFRAALQREKSRAARQLKRERGR
jgi:hypothetical protein